MLDYYYFWSWHLTCTVMHCANTKRYCIPCDNYEECPYFTYGAYTLQPTSKVAIASMKKIKPLISIPVVLEILLWSYKRFFYQQNEHKLTLSLYVIGKWDFFVCDIRIIFFMVTRKMTNMTHSFTTLTFTDINFKFSVTVLTWWIFF